MTTEPFPPFDQAPGSQLTVALADRQPIALGESPSYADLVKLARELEAQCLELASQNGQLETTRRAENARHQMEERLRQAQKLESLGVLAGGIAHDYNNLLTVIIGNAELALTDISATLPAYPRLKEIMSAAQRAAELTRQMQVYSGSEPLARKPVDLEQLIGHMRPMMEVAISKKAALHHFFAHRPLVVLADADHLRQVILNLLANASEALGDREGSITFVARSLRCDRPLLDRLRPDEWLPEGRYACLQVIDTGCGMSPAILGRAFEPFFTTKFTGRGLGLAVVQGIVRRHQGAIDVESTVGVGTTFRVLLPSAEKLEPRGEAPSEAPPAWQATGLALLVDDEEMVRTLGALLLARLGFQVLTAVDGYEAVTVFSEHASEITVVILDVTMPRMDGPEALREFRRVRPDVPVLVCSGYAEKQALSLFQDSASMGFLPKPFQSADLARALRALLERAPAASPAVPLLAQGATITR